MTDADPLESPDLLAVEVRQMSDRLAPRSAVLIFGGESPYDDEYQRIVHCALLGREVWVFDQTFSDYLRAKGFDLPTTSAKAVCAEYGVDWDTTSHETGWIKRRLALEESVPAAVAQVEAAGDALLAMAREG